MINKIKRHIPNILCYLRIIVVPFFLFCLLNNFEILCFILFLLGSLTDFFDGYLARKWKVESKLGALLDPLADKIFSNSALWGIYFQTHNPYFFIIATILTCRDTLLVFGALIVLVKKIHIELKPIFLSKACTAMLFTIIANYLLFGDKQKFFDVPIIACIGLICLTALLYFTRLFKR